MRIDERLKYARERAKLTGSQVKDRTGIGESSISDFENAKREPSLSQLQALAKAYRRSISFFLTDRPIPEETVLWREKPAVGWEEVEAHFLRLCEQYHNLETWVDDELSVRLPLEEGTPERFSYADAEALAKRVRDELQLGDRPALSLLSVLEEVCGIKIFHLVFEPTGTAASTFSETFGAGVLLNSNNVRWRRNFDLAHELFHLLTWHVFRGADETGRTSSCASKQEEKYATCFARNLLMPPEAVRTAIGSRAKDRRITFAALHDIARQFDVSLEALQRHMHFLYNRGQDDRARTEQEIARARAWARQFGQRPKSDPPTWPARYGALAIKALRQGEVSIGRFAEYMDISRQEALRFVEQEIMDDEEVQLTPA